MFGIAVGHCGLSISEFYAAELGEILCVVRSFYSFQEQKEQAKWERTRFLALWIIKPHDSKRKFKKLTDIVEYPWEQQNVLSPGDAHSFLDKAEAKAAINQQKWLDSLMEKGLLDTIN